MHFRSSLLKIGCLSLFLSVSVWIAAPNFAFAQGNPTVSAVTLQVVPGQQGQQCVVTPRGLAVPLPGSGVNSSTVQIYMGSQGGYWYVDKYGQTVDLTAAVQQLRAAQSTAPVPQSAPPPQSQGGSGAGTAAVTAAAAGLGAMTGAAVANSYNNVPYGTPLYYPRGAAPYYVDRQGNNVNVANTNVYSSNSAYYEHHAANLQNQQDWYAAQQKNAEQRNRWQQTSENPFVRPQEGAAAAAGNGEQGGGRFRRRHGASGEAASMEGEANDGGRGGRFRNQSDGGGGRFGRTADDQGVDRRGGADNAQNGDRSGRFGGGDADNGGRGGRRHRR